MNDMTWVWLLLWFGLSSIILGAFVWSVVILQKQKRSWEVLAEKYKLQYDSGRFMDSPTVTGMIGKFGVSCFGATRDPDDVKARRAVSVIEIKLPDGLVGSSAAGTKDMIPFLQTLSALKPHILSSDLWDKDKYYFFTSNPILAEEYFNEDRLKHLVAILGVKNAEVVILHDDNEAIVRVETPDPIQETAKAEKVINFLIRHAEGLMVTDEERKAIKQKRSS